MTVQRLLGAAWTAVHGPSDPARLLRWLLEQGMQGMVPGPAPRALGWRAIADAAEGLPIAFPAVRAGSILRDNSAVAGLASGRESDQLAARAAVAEAVGVARILGAR